MNEYKKPFGAGAHREGNFGKKDYSRPSFGGEPSFGGKPAFRGGAGKGFGPKKFGDRNEMHSATCASCGKACEVPFKPNGKKPIYCRDCFAANGGAEAGASRGPSDRFSAPRRDFAPRPAYSKPEYRSEARPQGDNGMGELKKQIEAIGAKLDKLIGIMGQAAAQNVSVPKSSDIPAAIAAPVSAKKPAAKKAAGKKKK